MPPLFNPRLIHPPTGDPALFVPFSFKKRALIFDLGDLSTLSPRDLLKITHVFVTHTHMDHFIGFDQLLRILLGREKTLHLFGPAGFLANVEGKLAGYTWNLVENYENPLHLVATEVLPDRLKRRRYDCRNRFFPEAAEPETRSDRLLDEPAFYVETAILEHDIACLGFAVKEHYHINIRKDTLIELSLPAGPWLYEFKQALYDDVPPESLISVPGNAPNEHRQFRLGELADNLAIMTPGQKFAYITDVSYDEPNISRMVKLAEKADHLFIEASFLEKDREHAGQKRHLTARQAGMIAALAGVGRFSLFHFSPRYEGQYDQLQSEALAAYREFC